MRDIKELMVLSKDFLKFATGNDYSRQPQPIGKYFCDRRCYYNDLRRKATWRGAQIDGVPALKMAVTGEPFLFPIDIFLYGLGSLDRYFFDKDYSVLGNVTNVARWMINNISSTGDFDNKWKEMSPHQEFYSNNSGMGQGLALSFAIRVVKYKLCDQTIRDHLADVIVRVKNNMLSPAESGGACLNNERGLFFMEFPRKDGNVVLNGWIFAVFGLYDYIHFEDDPAVERTLNITVKTMETALPDYHLHNGWALYDNMHRICSPFYQDLHIALLEGMYGITNSEVFFKYLEKARRANTGLNRLYFMTDKIVEKLFKDKEAYTSVS